MPEPESPRECVLDVPLMSRSSESGLFGKCDRQLTVYVSDATEAELKLESDNARVPFAEFLRWIFEQHVWGSAEVSARLNQRRLPMGIRRITGD